MTLIILGYRVPFVQITVISYLFASASFAIEYVAKLLGAKNKIQYVFFSDSVIDLGTIVSVWAARTTHTCAPCIFADSVVRDLLTL